MVKRWVLGALVALAVAVGGCSGATGAGTVLAKGWAISAAGARMLGLCASRPPAWVTAAVEDDAAEGAVSDAGAVGDASSPGVGDASAD